MLVCEDDEDDACKLKSLSKSVSEEMGFRSTCPKEEESPVAWWSTSSPYCDDKTVVQPELAVVVRDRLEESAWVELFGAKVAALTIHSLGRFVAVVAVEGER